jgi:CRP-like cAMP-binding protein
LVKSLAPTSQTTGNEFLDSLTAQDFALIESFLTQEHLAHNAVVTPLGAEVNSVLFPTGAILSIITMMEDGRGVESCTIGHESGYGLLNVLGSAAAFDRVISQVPGSALRIAGARLKAAATASPSLMDMILRHIQANLAQTQQSVACNALHPAEARLCRWLLMSRDRTRSQKLPLTQEFLGFMLGVQRTTVTAAARALQSAGLIRYSRGQIEILDHAGLEAGACECYAAVRERHAHLVGRAQG